MSETLDLDFEMVRGERVIIEPIFRETKKGTDIQSVLLTVGGHEHEFKKQSALVRQLKAVTTSELEERLSGGNFFFVDGVLTDFRGSDYKGFIHSDDQIKALAGHIGFNKRTNLHHTRAITPGFNRKTVMGGALDPVQFEVPGMQQGGYFTSKVSFMWNPFYREVRTHLALTRLVCDNGMTVTADSLNYGVPVVNDWQEGIDIAHRRLNNKMESVVVSGLEDATSHRASVATVSLLNQHITNRLKSVNNSGRSLEEMHNTVRRLNELETLTNVRRSLSDSYKSKVFENQSIGKMLPSNLTAFDAFNIATELSSHTEASQFSSNAALNAIANGIVFNSSEKRGQMALASTPNLSDFNDHDAAFMGAREIVYNEQA